MKIDLDDKWSLIGNRYGNPVLVKNAQPTKAGTYAGTVKYYFNTYGQAIKHYIMIASNNADISSLEELAEFIDRTLDGIASNVDRYMAEGKMTND